MNKLNRKGFTLVEIMIVVAIIGLLAAIAIPNLLRARVNANDQGVRGDLRTFSSAMESYRSAQNPPAYPLTNSSFVLTSATPPYLDSTWGDVSSTTRRGHALTLALDSAAGATYALTAGSITNQSVTMYCVDHTGVIRAGTAANAAAGCSTANTAISG